MPYETIQVRVCRCLRCGNKWHPRLEKPKMCPDCKSRDWDIPLEDNPNNHKCKNCGYSWKSRMRQPTYCPNCTSKNIGVIEYG